MKNVLRLLVLGAWIAAGWSAPGAAQQTPPPVGSKPEIVRLILTGGGFQDVRGPVERRDGQIFFRTLDGRLASVREADVREVRPRPPRAAPAPAAAPKRVAAADSTPTATFTNADLPIAPPAASAASEPPAPETGPPAAPEPVAGESGAAAAAAEPGAAPALTPAETAPAAVEGSGLALTPQPTLVAGHDRNWWSGEADRRRREIVALEQQENVSYRLWVCAMHGIASDSAACTPLLRAPVNREPTTPDQIAMTRRLAETRRDIEGRRAALADFLDRAMRAGVPAGWLLPGAEPPPAP